MNYHNITHCDTLNGSGLRVTLWVAGCNHHCKNCHNPFTWDVNGGIYFDANAMDELLDALNHDYISGLSLSGGDPMHPNNRQGVLNICQTVKQKFPDKDIWLYTGYELSMGNFTSSISVFRPILEQCDVVVDGPYIEEQRDVALPFRGSRNQRLIDVKETLKQGQIIQYKIN